MASELEQYFGTDSVFFDETAAEPGAQWPSRIREALNAANVVIVVIGAQWLQATDGTSGRRRIDAEEDWVREEILTALRRQSTNGDIHILPVLIGDSAMPHDEDLHETLAALCHFQPVRLPDTGRAEDFDDLKAQLVRWRFVPRVLPPVRTPVIGRVPTPLSEDDERALLTELEEWDILNTRDLDLPGRFRRELHRVYEFDSFDRAFQFMNEVAERAIRPLNHHPRWQNSYNRLEVWLTTFNAGYKPTKRDIRLARLCEEIWREFVR
jgi:pterin-4a-carbinolamine dehydratase